MPLPPSHKSNLLPLATHYRTYSKHPLRPTRLPKNEAWYSLPKPWAPYTITHPPQVSLLANGGSCRGSKIFHSGSSAKDFTLSDKTGLLIPSCRRQSQTKANTYIPTYIVGENNPKKPLSAKSSKIFHLIAVSKAQSDT